MEEKCYRDLQTQSGIGGIGLFEILALLAVPILLLPVLTLLDLSVIYIVVIEIALFVVFRMANKISPFEYGLVSFVLFHFRWPKKLSAYKLQEQDYLIKNRP